MTFADIKTRIYFLTGSDSASFVDADITIGVQRAQERVAELILKADAKWQFDDLNHTDLPIAKGALVSGQQDYSITNSFLTVDRVEIFDANGNKTRVSQIDQQQLKRDRSIALAQGETNRTGAYKYPNGIPTEYDISGSSIFFYPTPNFAGSFLVYYTRAPKLFDYTTGMFTDATGSTTSTPGFNSLFHDLIALWPSYDYGIKAGKQNTDRIFLEIQRKELDLTEFYGNRNRDDRPRLTVSTDSNK